MAENNEIADDWANFRELRGIAIPTDEMIVFRDGLLYRSSMQGIASGVLGQQRIETSPSENQSVASGAPSILDFDTVELTTGDDDFSVSGGRVTVFKSGVYNISAGFVVEAVTAALSQTSLLITRNAEVVSASQIEASIVATGNRALSASRSVRLNAGDIVDVRLGIVQAVPGSGSAIIRLVSTLLGLVAGTLNRLVIVRVG